MCKRRLCEYNEIVKNIGVAELQDLQTFNTRLSEL